MSGAKQRIARESNGVHWMASQYGHAAPMANRPPPSANMFGHFGPTAIEVDTWDQIMGACWDHPTDDDIVVIRYDQGAGPLSCKEVGRRLDPPLGERAVQVRLANIEYRYKLMNALLRGDGHPLVRGDVRLRDQPSKLCRRPADPLPSSWRLPPPSLAHPGNNMKFSPEVFWLTDHDTREFPVSDFVDAAATPLERKIVVARCGVGGFPVPAALIAGGLGPGHQDR